MDESKLTRFVRISAPLFLSLPFAVSATALAIGPSPVDALPDGTLARALPFLAGGMVTAGYAAYSFAFSKKRFVPFLAAASATCLSLIAISAVAGILLHRDFFTAAFQYVVTYPLALILYARFIRRAKTDKDTAKLLANTGIIVSGFHMEWIMLMGYAIVSRAEPRPIESMIYNLYNILLTTFLFFVSRSLKRTTIHTLTASPEGMKLGEKDITSLAGLKRTRLLHAFATAEGRRLRCPDIQRILYGAVSGEAGEPNGKGEHAGPDCAHCDPESAKAAQCGRYRSTYNSILELKKLIEFLEIGTIVSGENRRHVLEDGWRLVPFEGARIRTDK